MGTCTSHAKCSSWIRAWDHGYVLSWERLWNEEDQSTTLFSLNQQRVKMPTEKLWFSRGTEPSSLVWPFVSWPWQTCGFQRFSVSSLFGMFCGLFETLYTSKIMSFRQEKPELIRHVDPWYTTFNEPGEWRWDFPFIYYFFTLFEKCNFLIIRLGNY